MINFIKKFVFSQRCLSCYSTNTKPFHYLCPQCVPKLTLVSSLKNICPLCHDTWIQQGVCQNCSNQKPLWQQLHTVFSYKNKVIKELFHWYKFKDSVLAERDLITLLRPHTELFKHYHAIITPCSRPTLKRLGFNPVTKLVQQLNINYSEPFVKNKSVTFKKLDREHRKNSINSIVFDPKKLKTTEKLLLIDDIFTTGSTLTQVASVLNKNNINCFEALCFFRS